MEHTKGKELVNELVTALKEAVSLLIAIDKNDGFVGEYQEGDPIYEMQQAIAKVKK